MRRARRTPGVVVVGLLALGVVASCGSDSADPAPVGGSIPLSEADVRELPPNDPSALARIYDPVLEPMGLRVTRGALIEREGGTYEVSDDGRHLALYVEPTGERTNEQFLAGVWDVAALLTPDVFARFTEIESYDICQEPLPSDDDRPEPPPVSQIDVDRATAAAIDWEDGSLVDLVAASRRGDLLLRVDDEIAALPGWIEAATAAGDLLLTDSTTTSSATG